MSIHASCPCIMVLYLEIGRDALHEHAPETKPSSGSLTVLTYFFSVFCNPKKMLGHTTSRATRKTNAAFLVINLALW